jgi:hypothetical protein
MPSNIPTFMPVQQHTMWNITVNLGILIVPTHRSTFSISTPRPHNTAVAFLAMVRYIMQVESG